MFAPRQAGSVLLRYKFAWGHFKLFAKTGGEILAGIKTVGKANVRDGDAGPFAQLLCGVIESALL